MRAASIHAATPYDDSGDLRERVRELEEALRAVRAGHVDAFVTAGGLATSEPARAAADRLREGTLQQMRDAVLAFDLSGHVIYMNPAAQRQYGWVAVEALGRPRAAIYDEWADTDSSDTGVAPYAAHVHRLRDGRFIHVESTVSPLRDADGLVYGSVAVIRDVTERRRERVEAVTALRESEARLRDANAHLETAIRQRTSELMAAEEALRQAQKMEAVGQLTGGIAHDFNNLLASISGSLQVLRAKLARGQSEGSARYVEMGLESVKRAAALTQRLLAFARRQTLAPKPTDINRLVAGMEDLIRRTVGTDVAMEVAGSDDLWTTKVDPPQLEGALLNLCINARDAMMPAGGRLRITTGNLRVDSASDAQRGLAPGDYVVLRVADTGSGMPPEVVERIFDPFFTTKPLGQGTGLGLSMVYGFVRQSGGEVRVISEVGAGTTMCLYLPRHDGLAEDAQAEAVSLPPEGGRGETVLLIEDQESIRTVVEEVLESAGYHVLTAVDGPAGLHVLQGNRRIDLLLTDVGLPGGLNGRQVADAGRVGRPGLKVLFITGYAESAAVGAEQLDSGMAILAKPFELDTLARRVREMIG